MKSLLVDFPKKRPALPPAYSAIYEAQYASNRNGDTTAASLSQRMERWMHRCVAADAGPDKPTLEIGAGTLNQLAYEPSPSIYDVIEPMVSLYETSPARARVRSFYANINEVPPDRRYARITSVAALEHICDFAAGPRAFSAAA